MKTERRHELENNELAEWLTVTIERVRPYSRALLAGVIAVAVLIFGMGFVRQRRATQRTEAWNAFFTAVNTMQTEPLNEVVTQYAGSEVGLWAELRLADLQLAEGTDLLFTNRPAALDELRSAEEHYTSVRDQADNPEVRERALMGLARSLEALNRLDDAQAAYRQVTEDYPEGLFAPTAQQRLADLERQGTKEFYDWFATQDPRPASETSLGPGGNQPDFNFESLPDDSSSLLPSGGAIPGDTGGAVLDLGSGSAEPSASTTEPGASEPAATPPNEATPPGEPATPEGAATP